jgi:hypothetical protein
MCSRPQNLLARSRAVVLTKFCGILKLPYPPLPSYAQAHESREMDGWRRSSGELGTRRGRRRAAKGDQRGGHLAAQ